MWNNLAPKREKPYVGDKKLTDPLGHRTKLTYWGQGCEMIALRLRGTSQHPILWFKARLFQWQGLLYTLYPPEYRGLRDYIFEIKGRKLTIDTSQRIISKEIDQSRDSLQGKDTCY